MKKIIPLIFSVLYALNFNAQAVGGWGTCEFADVATMNAFDPSTNAYDCKKVFVQATNNHYYWNGTIWVLVQDTDDQNASEVPFTPVGTIVAADVQAAIAEIEPDIYGSVGVHSDVDVTTTTPSSGDILAWDGSNFVPLTLEAGNIPYDNVTSGLTATDAQAAIDELAAGSSSVNIYTDNGTLDANREVSLGNFDLEFNSTGTGDFFVSDNGTIAFAVEDDHVGIGIASPTNPLHIYESTGTPASATNGTIFLEKGNSGGSQSIVFQSRGNVGNDYGFIEYSDDGSGNGSDSENSLLAIGVQNDGPGHPGQDDIAILPSGNLGVGTVSPDAFFDVDGGNVRFSDYGGGAITGTVTQILGVNVDGDVIEVDPSTLGGSSDNIYTADGDLGEDRVVTLDGNDLTLDGTSDVVFKSDGKIGLGINLPLSPLHINADGTGTNGIIKVEGTEPDIIFDDTDGGSTTFTFQNAGTGQVAFGKNNSNDFYITRNQSGWQDDSFVLQRSTGNVGIGTSTPDALLDVEGGNVRFSDYGDGTVTGTATQILGVDIDGDVIEIAPSTLTPDNLGDHTAEENVQMINYWISSDGDDEGIFIKSNGNVGIGTDTPNAFLDVAGGQVRFSDYGTGTYEDTTAIYLLGVEADGDLVEMNTAKNSRIFYPPAIAIVVDSVGTGFDLNLHESYTALFSGGGSSFVKSTTAPGAIPTYAADELYYYILDYDDSIFDNVTINDVGIMEYDIIATAVNNCSFINIVFVVKEP